MKCEICGYDEDYGKMFGKRCAGCQVIGFGIWGFGEEGEMKRDKELIEEQRRKIFAKYGEESSIAIYGG